MQNRIVKKENILELLEQRTFIRGIPPFDRVANKIVDKIAENLDIAYFRAEEVVLQKGAMPEFLYFIIKGVVHEREEEEILSIYTSGELFDPVSLIEKYARHTFVAAEETICYILPGTLFLELLHEESYLEHYFFQSISQKLSSACNSEQNAVLADFMMARVEDAYLQKPLIVDGKTTIYEAVKMQHQKKANALLVKSDAGIGIVTDSDFREKFILQKRSFEDRVSTLMHMPLITISKSAFLFNAQILMTKHHIKHLVVEDEEGKIAGILDQLSLASFFASHTYAIANAIERAEDLEALKKASQDLIKITRALFAKGVKVRYIARLISQLNAKIFEKLFLFLAPQELVSEACVIVMGSEGREEQILKTDQDNALIISDKCEIGEAELEEFCQRYTQNLIDFGYPECPGGIMLSNPQWRMRESAFKARIGLWLERKNSDDMMYTAIFYDAMCVAGNLHLLEDLRSYLLYTLGDDSAFYARFARAIESFEVPLGIFSDFVVEKRGEHKNELDIKKGGIFTIVHGVRSLAIEKGITETNSVSRLKLLNDMGILDKQLTADLIESFTYFMTLRLQANLERVRKKEAVSNYIDPGKLSRIEKDLLKDAFKTVGTFKKFLIYHYKLNLLG
jgi:CBS domain-containing protein